MRTSTTRLAGPSLRLLGCHVRRHGLVWLLASRAAAAPAVDDAENVPGRGF